MQTKKRELPEKLAVNRLSRMPVDRACHPIRKERKYMHCVHTVNVPIHSPLKSWYSPLSPYRTRTPAPSITTKVIPVPTHPACLVNTLPAPDFTVEAEAEGAPAPAIAFASPAVTIAVTVAITCPVTVRDPEADDEADLVELLEAEPDREPDIDADEDADPEAVGDAAPDATEADCATPGFIPSRLPPLWTAAAGVSDDDEDPADPGKFANPTAGGLKRYTE